MKSQSIGYAALADQLRECILSGAVAPGHQLPTERDLARHYSVSRITVRRALRILETESLIRRRQGSGTFVCPRPVRRIPVMMDYSTTMREHAPTLRRAVLKAGWVEAPDWVAGRLGLPAGVRIFRAERVDTLGEQPVAWDEAFIVQSFTKGLDRRLLKRVNFFDVWVRRSGFSAGTDEQLVEAVPASAACARRLRIARSAPVLKCTETFFMNSRVPVAVFVSYYHPGYMCIRSRSPWSVSRRRGRPVIGSSDFAKHEPGATG